MRFATLVLATAGALLARAEPPAALIPLPREVRWSEGVVQTRAFALQAEGNPGIAQAAAERIFPLKADGLPLILAIAPQSSATEGYALNV